LSDLSNNQVRLFQLLCYEPFVKYICSASAHRKLARGKISDVKSVGFVSLHSLRWTFADSFVTSVASLFFSLPVLTFLMLCQCFTSLMCRSQF